MNDVKHQKTGRWSVAAFKQAARELTMPLGRWDAVPGEDLLLAIFDPRLPLVDFDPLTAGAMDDKAAAANAGQIDEENSSITASQDAGKDSGSWAFAAGHPSDGASFQAHRVAEHVPSPPAPALLPVVPGAVNRHRSRPWAIARAKDSDSARAETFSTAPRPATAAGGHTAERPPSIAPQKRLHGTGRTNGMEPGNDASQLHRAQAADPLGSVARQLRTLTDVLLGPSGIPDKTASGKAQAPSLRQQDDRRTTARSSDRQVPRSPGRLRQPPVNSPPADHRGQRQTEDPLNQAAKPKKALGKTDRQGEASPKGRGGGNHHRSVEDIPGRRHIATIDLVSVLTGQVGQQTAAVNRTAQPEGQAIQTDPLTDGRQTSPTSPASEMPPARPAAHTARPRPMLSALPPSDDHMPAERLADMINDVLVSQARRHGVDLS